MEIRNLVAVPLPTIVESLLHAFENYFVPMPREVAAWEERFARSGVDWSLSFGAFHEGEPVAFIIHAIGMVNGERTAFNTGTGVVPSHRGKQLVDRLYVYALPELRRAGIDACSLEVITKNTAAVRVYERIGFAKAHTWKCFLGRPAGDGGREQWNTSALSEVYPGDDRWHSWDHRLEALQRIMGGYRVFTLGSPRPWSHAIIDPATGRVARLGVSDEHDRDQWTRLVRALANFNVPIRLVNVHPERTTLIDTLIACGLLNDIDQFEMRMPVRT